MSILAVTYHYVRPDSPSAPRLRYLHLDNFRKQLDWLCENRRAISRDEFVSIAKGEIGVTDGFILTFDDGLLDHCKFVFPELVKRGLWGSFYIPVEPYISHRPLDVHLVHGLLGVFGGEKVLQVLEKIIQNSNVSVYGNRGSHRYTRADDEAAVLEVKRQLNYGIAVERRSEIIDGICEDLNFAMDPRDWYLSASEMNEMASAGMIIGSHSMSHRPMAQLSDEIQELEISKSFEWIEMHLENPMDRSFCYPYGGFDTFTPATESILNKNGSLWAFNNEEREILQSDFAERPQALPRIDCCNLPFGKAHKYDS